MNDAVQVAVVDTGGRTKEQKEEITRISEKAANLLAEASCPEVLVDVLISMIASSALNTRLDEDLIGMLVAECMRVFPIFKAARDAQDAQKARAEGRMQ